MAEPTASAERTETAAGSSRRRHLGLVRDAFFRYGIYVILAALLVTASIVQSGFLTRANLQNILSQNAPLGVIAVGMTFVLIAGGFDLSVGAVVSLAAVLFASLAQHHSLAVAAAAGVGAGLAGGLCNGVAVTRLRVNPFVATLGAASIFEGLTLIYSNGQAYYVTRHSFTWLGAGTLGPLPVSVWILLLCFVLGGVLLAKTRYGRMVYAVGGNEDASRLSGIRVGLIRTSTYVLTGGLAALAGLMLASRVSDGQPNMAPSITLDALAVVVIGGPSLLGGEGTLVRTFVGLMILAVLTNVFFGSAVNPNWQLIIKGFIIIGAVALDYFSRQRTRT
jgi:ribose/xylose/arabinose/galactoside ABC-type transport system permease subunit